MIVTQGGKFGGYGLYLVKGKPVFNYNLLALKQFRWAPEVKLTAGRHKIVFDFKYDGPGLGKGGVGVLSLDGKEAVSKQISQTIPVVISLDETFDVGVDNRTGLDDADYKVPFQFDGKIVKLTFDLGPSQAIRAAAVGSSAVQNLTGQRRADTATSGAVIPRSRR